MKFNAEKIIEKISKYEIVSFDIFDTLIKRSIANPKDLFEFVKLQYEKKYNAKIDNFKNIRVNAEIQARNKSNKQDINYDDIYNEILNISNLEADVVRKLKEIELDLELDVCEKNTDFYPIYKYCIDNNKKIIIVSDMYLHKRFIEKLLNKNGYYNYMKIYISSEIGLLKSTGDIFDFVLKDLNISSKSIIHIGDAKRGDWIMPKVRGINSILIPTNINHLKFNNTNLLNNEQRFQYDNLSSFININLSKYKSKSFLIGYEVLGPVLFGFSKWLLKNIDSTEPIFFLSREGNLIKKSFDIIKPDNIKTEYMYVSRRSTMIPILYDIDSIEDLFNNISLKKGANIKDLFNSCGLNYNNYTNYLQKIGYNEFTYVSDARKNKKLFKEFFDGIIDDIRDNSRKEYKNLLGYLKQINFKDNVNIVDIGWRCSMQNALMNIFKKENQNINIKGYYLGVTTSSSKFIKNGMKAKGYLFNNSFNIENQLRILSFVGLCEIFFQAQHGSTKYYECKENKYIPFLDEYEFSEKDKETIIELQNGALKFVEEYNKSVHSKLLNCDETVLSKNLFKLGSEPTFKEIEMFGKINFLDGKVESLIGKNNILYFFNIKKLKANFLNSSWKVAFLKNLFKININYYKIYKNLKKFDK